ncbi:TIGR01458 family HAD-type hydrolase [Rhodoblastus acidophilus]|uniref:Haloacid dehalogenase-like hydrolase domain-containing protein 2 n=1 Tax=Rhodoblastus acidophilus TaxID=1074 RepID=A0A6N8DP57_RHOAC|nr:TIGR01458 family HAD-type hydrolase [Rhodoblastus acidophilus]MCW2273873.1 HAD superfamily hydrolase (TIGR01458 family) [Rhodoblastus acidophilus]MTV30983.1 TIGR01458 family HAD-type hydrolase [Rhodoblastus acidophilus]
MLSAVRGLLLDLDGVVTVGGAPLPGALEAIAKLRGAGAPLRFVTNTTTKPRRRLIADLAHIGLHVDPADLFTPASLARDHLRRSGAQPFLLIHPDLLEDFDGVEPGEDAVVIGDARDAFSYANLNHAFRLIHDGAEFLALARNRNFLDGDRKLSLDVGGFVAALEYASDRTAHVFGKPSADFFLGAVAAMGLAPAQTAMIGDDAEADIGGAMAAGLAGILVRTGKYRPGHEKRVDPTLVADDLAQAVEKLLQTSERRPSGETAR